MGNHHHSIHLGAAWEPPVAVEPDGRRRWTRRFGRPGGLERGDLVLLVVTLPTVTADVVVNGVRLPQLSAGTDRWAQDITPLLRDRNDLFLTVATDAGVEASPGRRGRGLLPSPIGIVGLEIVAADGGADRSADA